jgi:N-acetylglutamate synthase-like GNAT family acetyltransferase
LFLPDGHNILNFTIRAPASETEWQKYYQLRWQILRQPWQQPPGSEKDELEEQAFHCAAFSESNQIIAVARLHLCNNHLAQIRYMAVDPQFQSSGIGTTILNAIEATAKENNVEKIELNARENAINFYRKNGYDIVRPAHTLYNSIKHMLMQKKIS